MSNEVCICIPKVEQHVNKGLIQKTFSQHNIGHIKKIHLIQSKDKTNKLAFIYFKELYNNKNGELVKDCVENEKDFKIIYNFPWFWKCYKAKS